jgi:hypothetical protein
VKPRRVVARVVWAAVVAALVVFAYQFGPGGAWSSSAAREDTKRSDAGAGRARTRTSEEDGVGRGVEEGTVDAEGTEEAEGEDENEPVSPSASPPLPVEDLAPGESNEVRNPIDPEAESAVAAGTDRRAGPDGGSEGSVGDGGAAGGGAGGEHDVEQDGETAAIDVEAASGRIRDALSSDRWRDAENGLAALDRVSERDPVVAETARTLELRLRGSVRLRVDELVRDVRAGRALAAARTLAVLRREAEAEVVADALARIAAERGWPPLDARSVGAEEIAEPPPLADVRIRWEHDGRRGTGRILGRSDGEVRIAGDDGLFPTVPRLACEPISLGSLALARFALDQAAAALRDRRVDLGVVWLVVALEAAAGVVDAVERQRVLDDYEALTARLARRAR